MSSICRYRTTISHTHYTKKAQIHALEQQGKNPIRQHLPTHSKEETSIPPTAPQHNMPPKII